MKKYLLFMMGFALCLISIFNYSTCSSGGENKDALVVYSSGKVLRYTPADLQKYFQKVAVRTTTPWSGGRKAVYRGTPLLAILQRAGIAGATGIKLSAENGFAATISVDDIRLYNPIIASEVECTDAEVVRRKCRPEAFRPLSVQDFGPLFLVWPYDQMPASANPCDHSYWLWFLNEIREN
jgi:hypothetical protein